jgi:hypothetical protein
MICALRLGRYRAAMVDASWKAMTANMYGIYGLA